jgi:hypothetical protein
MLDAFNKKGVRKILGRSGLDHTNEKNEDAITSMVFSPLRYMSILEALSCFKAFLGPNFISQLSDRTLKTMNIQLWPGGLRAYSAAASKVTRCEPDLVARLTFDRGRPLIIVGEMKWDSFPTASELQAEIDRERAALLAEYLEHELFSFALVKYVKNEFLNLASRVLSWTEFHRELETRKGGAVPQSASLAWLKDVSSFLTRAEQSIFLGISKTYGPIPASDTRNLFYNGLFTGLSLQYGYSCVAKHIFYSQGARS